MAVKFHNGEPFNADAVVHNVKRIRILISNPSRSRFSPPSRMPGK
jgi:ABC-type transport system substrate-binding protein